MGSASRWRVAPTAAHHAEALAELTRIVFPTLDPSECFAADHYRKHVEIFPEGQFVALTGADRPVASTTTLRLNLDLGHPQHRFPEFLGGLYLAAHDPAASGSTAPISESTRTGGGRGSPGRSTGPGRPRPGGSACAASSPSAC